MNIPDINKSMFPWLGKTAKMMSSFMEDKFKQHQLNLTGKQWIVLKKLHEKDGVAQNDLALVTERNKASLARLINTMEKKNLVARIPCIVDKRVNKICLTKNGRNVFAATVDVVKEINEEMKAGISESEEASLIKILKKVQQNISI